MIKENRIRQFHTSPKAAIAYVNKSISEPHGMMARDFQGKQAVFARKSRKQPGAPINGRKLYDIYLKNTKEIF